MTGILMELWNEELTEKQNSEEKENAGNSDCVLD